MPQNNTPQALQDKKTELENFKQTQNEKRQNLTREEQEFIDNAQSFSNSLNKVDNDSQADAAFKQALAGKYDRFKTNLGIAIDSIDHNFDSLVNEYSPSEELKNSLRNQLNTLIKQKEGYERTLVTVQSEKSSKNNLESLTNQINVLYHFIQLTDHVNDNYNSESETTLVYNLGRIALGIINSADNQQTVSDLLKSYVDLSNSGPKSELIYQVAQPLLKALDTRDLNERKQYLDIFKTRFSYLKRQNNEANSGQKSATITHHNLDLPQPNELKNDRTMSAASNQNESEAEEYSGNDGSLYEEVADNNATQQGSNEQEVGLFLDLLQRAISTYHFSKNKNSKTNASNQIAKELNHLVKRITAENGITRQQCIDTFSKNIDVLLLFVKKCHYDNRLPSLLEDELKKLVDNIPQEQYTNVQAREQFARLRDISQVYRNDHLSPSIGTIYRKILAQPHVQKYFKNNPDDAAEILQHSYSMFEAKWNQDNQPKNTASNDSSQVKVEQQTNESNVNSPINNLNQAYTNLVRSAKKSQPQAFKVEDINNQIRMIVEQHGHANSKEEKTILDKQLGEFLKDGIIFKNKHLQTLDKDLEEFAKDGSDKLISVISSLSNIDDTNIREKYLDVFLNNKKRLNKILSAKYHSQQFTAKFGIKPIPTSDDQENEPEINSLDVDHANAGHLRRYLNNRKIRARVDEQVAEIHKSDELKAEIAVHDVIDNAKHKSPEDVANAINKLINAYKKSSANAYNKANLINQETLEYYLNKLLNKDRSSLWNRMFKTSAYTKLQQDKDQILSVYWQILNSNIPPELANKFLPKLEQELADYKGHILESLNLQTQDNEVKAQSKQRLEKTLSKSETFDIFANELFGSNEKSTQAPNKTVEGVGRAQQQASSKDEKHTEESDQQYQTPDLENRESRMGSSYDDSEISDEARRLQEEQATSPSGKFENAQQAREAINNATTPEALSEVMQQIDHSFYDPLKLDNEEYNESRLDIMRAVQDQNRSLETSRNQYVPYYRVAWREKLSLTDKQKQDEQLRQQHDQSLTQDNSIAQSEGYGSKNSNQRRQVNQKAAGSNKIGFIDEAESKTDNISKIRELKHWINDFRDRVRDTQFTPEMRANLVNEFSQKTQELKKNLNAQDQTDKLITRINLVDNYRKAAQKLIDRSRKDLPNNPPESSVAQQLNDTKPILNNLEKQLEYEEKSVNFLKGKIDSELNKIDNQLSNLPKDITKINISPLQQATQFLENYLKKTDKQQVKTDLEETIANDIRGCYDELNQLDGLSKSQKQQLNRVCKQLQALHPQHSYEAAASSASNSSHGFFEQEQEEYQTSPRTPVLGSRGEEE